MSTKANWGDIYAEKNKTTVDMGGREIWYVKTPINIEFTFVGLTSEYRAKQICALPKMVELLKICCFAGSLNCDAAQKKIAKPAQDILREIGEVE